jgi:hypothetical protein
VPAGATVISRKAEVITRREPSRDARM